jgi:NitT/TauT family transport system permease protein
VIQEVNRHPDFFKLEYIPRRGNFFNLPTTVFLSMRRVFLGLAIAFVVSFVVGLLISYVQIVRRLLLPIIRLLAPISPIAWLPLIQFFIGVGDTAIVFVIFIALFFILTLGTINSIENVESKFINTAKVLGASRWQTMFHVTIPAIVPEQFFSLRMNFYAAWMSLLVAEFIGAQSGLGQMVMAGRVVFNMQLVLLAMVIVGVLGMLSEAILRVIQEKVLWWRKEAEI